MMKPEFDAIAENYDQSFTDLPIGRLQRNQVHRFLDPILLTLKSKNVLDLGCGTGEDAIWFARKDFVVTAIDYSPEMIQVANQKSSAKNLHSKIKYYPLSITELEQLPDDLKFDLIFSDFGALNCIDPSFLTTLSQNLYNRLEPHGHFVAVILNRFCLWESFYFILKRKFKRVFRRINSDGIMAPLTNDVKIKTHYYSPGGFYFFFQQHFKKSRYSPIGLFVPPSYLTWFEKQKNIKWLIFLDKLDQLNPFKTVSSYASDHFIIHMTRK